MENKREIKFRVWNDYKNIYEHLDMGGFVPDIYIHPLGEVFNIDEWSGYAGGGADIKRIDVILEQFTGLRDKNGVDIYEGDIIKPPAYHPISEVFMMNGSWKINGRYSKIGFGSWADKTEVIGNVHENPELLKS